MNMLEWHWSHYMATFFSRTVVFGFPLDPFLGHTTSARNEFYGWSSHVMDLKFNQILVSYFYKLCVTIAIVYLAGRSSL